MNNEQEEDKGKKEDFLGWRASIRSGWALGLGWLVVILLIMWLLHKVGVLE